MVYHSENTAKSIGDLCKEVWKKEHGDQTSKNSGYNISEAARVAKASRKESSKKDRKKAAKKTAAKHAKEPGKDELRAFGHLGRINAAKSLVSDDKLGKLLQRLITFAGKARGPENAKTLAESLRAAEHVLFAALQIDAEHPMALHPKLEEQIETEMMKLKDRLEDHQPAEALGEMRAKLVNAAERAYKNRNLASALEMMRGAEALGHAGELK